MRGALVKLTCLQPFRYHRAAIHGLSYIMTVLQYIATNDVATMISMICYLTGLATYKIYHNADLWSPIHTNEFI